VATNPRSEVLFTSFPASGEAGFCLRVFQLLEKQDNGRRIQLLEKQNNGISSY